MAHETVPQSFRRDKIRWSLLLTFAAVLCIAGGASRADAAGQVVTRAGVWIISILFLLLVPMPPMRQVRPPALLLAGAVLLLMLQLVPLPPALWVDLPGRQLFAETAQIVGIDQPWRPLSIAPGETINSLGAMIVPITALFLLASVPDDKQYRIAIGLLAIILGACVLGAVEFSGAGFDHPLVNDVAGEVSGLFANRNHFAVFAVLGCTIAPYVAFSGRRSFRTALMLALGMEILCILLVLAIGSRAGILLAPVGLALGFATVGPQLRHSLERPSQFSVLIPIAGAVGVLIAIVVATLLADRSLSLERFMAEGADAGLRGVIRPALYLLIGTYFPVGTGFGAFDAAYRIIESRELLSPSYLNAAHNDFLQVVIEGGLLGALLLLAAVGWWAWASLAAWRDRDAARARLGSSIVFIIGLASLVDYPGRTPIFMAVLVAAAIWLARGPARQPKPLGIRALR